MSWAALQEDLVRLLQVWPVGGPAERALVQRYLAVVSGDGISALRKGDLPYHFTASVVVLSDDLTHVLLGHHRKADAWLQFGGHLEDDDISVEAAARREGTEESGVALTGPLLPVGLDAHLLGTGFSACREHLDVRFATTVPAGTRPMTSEESHEVRWFAVDDLPTPSTHELPRLVRAAVAAVTATTDGRS